MTSYWKDIYTGKVVAFESPPVSDTDVTNVVCQNAEALHPGMKAKAVMCHKKEVHFSKDKGPSKPGSWGVNLQAAEQPGMYMGHTPVMFEPISEYEAFTIAATTVSPAVTLTGAAPPKSMKNMFAEMFGDEFVQKAEQKKVQSVAQAADKLSLNTGLKMKPFLLGEMSAGAQVKILDDGDLKGPAFWYSTPAPQSYVIVAIDHDVEGMMLHVTAMNGQQTVKYSVPALLLGKPGQPQLGATIQIVDGADGVTYSPTMTAKSSHYWEVIIDFGEKFDLTHNYVWTHEGVHSIAQGLEQKLMGWMPAMRVRITAEREGMKPLKLMYTGSTYGASEWVHMFRKKYGK
jgi:hypothetical protein